MGKISGAVGTFANVDPGVEAFVMARLGLEGAEGAATQVVARDRHADLFCAIAVAGAVMEQQATEVRHLQRTEVREAEEPFTAGQKGSSAMPHKRNPILSENLTGLARLLRGWAVPALEDVALWHERDISHSSVERVIGPDATIALDFGLQPLRPDDRRPPRLSGAHEGEPGGRPAASSRPSGCCSRWWGRGSRARRVTSSSSATP